MVMAAELELELELIELVVLPLLMLLSPPNDMWSMDSDLDMHRLAFWLLGCRKLVKPLSELIERRKGRICPLKNTSSAAHIWVSMTWPHTEPKSNSSTA